MTDRRKDPKHRAFVSTLQCAACGAPAPSECAHVRMGTFDGATVPLHERGGMGLKPADKWSVPLCRGCHRAQHMGETTFWIAQGKNPLELAKALYRNTGNNKIAQAILYRARMGVTI